MGAHVGEGIQKGSFKFNLKGQRLKGKWVLMRLKDKEDETKENWLLIKIKDEYSKSDDGISEFTECIRTGRSMTQIEANEEEKNIQNPFDQADAQLAKLVNTVPEDGDWLYEVNMTAIR